MGVFRARASPPSYPRGMICGQCGHANAPNTALCERCGSGLSQYPPAQAPGSSTAPGFAEHPGGVPRDNIPQTMAHAPVAGAGQLDAPTVAENAGANQGFAAPPSQPGVGPQGGFGGPSPGGPTAPSPRARPSRGGSAAEEKEKEGRAGLRDLWLPVFSCWRGPAARRRRTTSGTCPASPTTR